MLAGKLYEHITGLDRFNSRKLLIAFEVHKTFFRGNIVCTSIGYLFGISLSNIEGRKKKPIVRNIISQNKM